MQWLRPFIDSPWVNTFILANGLYRIYDGYKRLRHEAKEDNRLDKIPDEDVRELWQKLSKLNSQFGRFFCWYGGYLIFLAAMNTYFYGYLDLDFGKLLDQSMNVPSFVVAMILIVIGLCLIGRNQGRVLIAILNVFLEESNMYFTATKEDIFRIYQKLNFVSRNDEIWSKKENRYIAFLLKKCFSNYKLPVIGSIILYSTIILLSFYLMCCQLYFL